MTNGIGHRVIAISRIFLKDQWKFLPWWLLSKSEYNDILGHFFNNLRHHCGLGQELLCSLRLHVFHYFDGHFLSLIIA